MLVEFKVANFRSFAAEATLSMVASKDAAHPASVIPCDRFSLLKSAAIYGANASGKSNLVKAIQAMEQFVLTSATRMNAGDRIDIATPFRLSADTLAAPSRFEVTCLIDGHTYVYGFSVTGERVTSESLRVRKADGRMSTWFDRKTEPTTGKSTLRTHGPLAKDADLLRERTRDNGLVLSRGAELNVAALRPLYLWFHKRILTLNLSFPPIGLAQQTANRISSDAELRKRVVRMIRDADFGIVDLAVKEESPFARVPNGAPADVHKLLSALQIISEHVSKTEKLSSFVVETRHLVGDSGDAVTFRLDEEESNGTQRYFALIGPVLEVLDKGFLLVVDEFDCSLHPLLTRKLVELFNSADANRHGAQLILVTHDTTLMDSRLLRRDQLWLTEKRADGSTDLYSLYDFDTKTRPRKTEAFERNYLSGRYGGVPSFGPALEDLEIR